MKVNVNKQAKSQVMTKQLIEMKKKSQIVGVGKQAKSIATQLF